MTSLGGKLPEELRKKLAIEHLKVGSVLRMHVADTVPPKIKRLIVVGIEPTKVLLATIFINTDINPHIFNSEELKRLQMKLEPKICSFVEHDSYADCSTLRERSFIDIQKLMEDDPSLHIGEVPLEVMKSLKELIKSAKTIPIRVKKKYSLFF